MKPKNNPKKHKKLPVYIDEEIFVKLISNLISRHHKIACLLAFESGLRISEVTGLKKENFDFKNNRIKVINGKGGKDRWVMLPRDWDEDYIDFIPVDCSNRALQTAFYTARDRAELDHNLHFHSLRHSFATHMINQGMKIEKISILLGHEDVSTTMIYIHMNPQEIIDEGRRRF